MNDEKKIASAILDAQKMREESFVSTKNRKLYEPVGEYKLDIEECLIATCKQRGLSPNLWALLNLTMSWWNDVQLWAEDVLAGKNILEECEKENAEMDGGLKVAPSDEQLTKELTTMNDVLKAEKKKGKKKWKSKDIQKNGKL